jgi:nucleotidyltransferase/DNA polymerase involved in DNA repair
MPKKWILHIDGDAFFASVEVSRRPDLFGKPVVVGEERGIATALTYPAKNLGIKRGDAIFKIKREYKDVTILSSHFELYRKFAHNLADILIPEVDEFEAYSIDECFATIHGNCQEVEEKVKRLKTMIQSKLGITYSFGVSTTKTLAKVASKFNKPNGLCFLMNEADIKNALEKTKVENLWGVGWATDKKVKIHNIKSALDFINSDLKSILKSSYNKNIFETYEELCGIKHFEVGGKNAHKKSIQSTRTFLQATNIKKTLTGELSRNVEIACSELRSAKLKTNKIFVFLKPKERGQKYFEKVFDLPFFTNSDTTALKYIEQAFDELNSTQQVVYKKSGVIMLNLLKENEIPEDLFNTQVTINKDESKITSLVDSLRNKYGFGIIGLATSLETTNNRGKDYDRRHVADNYEHGLPYPFLGIIK